MAKALHEQRKEPIAIAPKEVERLLDYGTTKVAKLIRLGELQSFVDGGSRRVLTSSIAAYVARRLAAAPSKKSTRRGGPGRPRKVTP
jgi:hypothetical protein